MNNKVETGTEKYPNKRGYAIGKLQKFLKLSNLTKAFRENCIKQESKKGQRNISTSFIWNKSTEGLRFWTQVNNDFEAYCDGKKVFRIYEN